MGEKRQPVVSLGAWADSTAPTAPGLNLLCVARSVVCAFCWRCVCMIDRLVCLCLPFLTGGSLGPASQSELFSNIDNQFFGIHSRGLGFGVICRQVQFCQLTQLTLHAVNDSLRHLSQLKLN